jgi:hypothetical protein
MATSIPPDALLRLKERGRATGQLTVADLAKELPVDGMDAEDVALVIAHLEEAGIPVTLDAELLTPRPGTPAATPPAFELPRDPQGNAAPASPATSEASPPRFSPAARPAPAARPRYANGTVLVAGILALVILLALAWAFMR